LGGTAKRGGPFDQFGFEHGLRSYLVDCLSALAKQRVNAEGIMTIRGQESRSEEDKAVDSLWKSCKYT
jgi:hypothetical protein